MGNIFDPEELGIECLALPRLPCFRDIPLNHRLIFRETLVFVAYHVAVGLHFFDFKRQRLGHASQSVWNGAHFFYGATFSLEATVYLPVGLEFLLVF